MFTISSLPCLRGKTFLVTGGNTGIGYMTCLNLAAKDGKVYMGARSTTKASAAISKIKELHPHADIHPLIMDLSSLATVVKAAKQLSSQESKLHGLILNAGIMATPYLVTPDGFESQMQVNYLAHWLLTYHLLPILLSTSKSEGPGSVRIACVSSEGHQQKTFPFGVDAILYDQEEIERAGPYRLYGLSKLANVIHAKNMHSQYGPGSKSTVEGAGELWVASLHPGFVDTQLNEINRDNASWKWKWLHSVLKIFGIMRPWDEGCISSLFVAASPDFKEEMSGRYFNHKAKLQEESPVAKKLNEQETLENWTRTVLIRDGWI